ncbi:eclosion hormone-like [Onthophagus taurus]|uniref:eclosion hormone-like n=1 Tax=Onthophagus taurus TaxID=166361 RepID=UPI0039BE34E0
MASNKIIFGLFFLVLISFDSVYSNTLGICVKNCAQCKRMYGRYFNGETCAKMCIKFKGNFIPDCEDIGSIEPFLNKIDNNNIDY